MAGLFDERERGCEANWARKEQTRFAVMVRRNAWLGQWAAKTMQLPAGETDRYVQAVIDVGLRGTGKDPVFNKIRRDFDARMLGCPDAVIQTKMNDFLEAATATVTKGSNHLPD